MASAINDSALCAIDATQDSAFADSASLIVCFARKLIIRNELVFRFLTS